MGREQRVRDDRQQVERPEHRCRDNHPERHEGGEPGIARKQREHDQHARQQGQRVDPRRGHQATALDVFDASESDDQMNQKGRHNGRKQRIGGNGDDKRREQGFVDDLQRDDDPEHARCPDEVIVKAARGLVVFLHQAALRRFDCEQPARDAMAE
jgi:hypothetical protein